jgi:hypothetical protein
LLYRSVEGVQIRMQDGGCRCHPDPLPRSASRTFLARNIMRTSVVNVKPQSDQGARSKRPNLLCGNVGRHAGCHPGCTAAWGLRRHLEIQCR